MNTLKMAQENPFNEIHRWIAKANLWKHWFS